MTAGHHATDRAVLRISGPDARDFLQGLVTNDVRRLDAGAVYAALLSPQGKYLFDFFLVADGEDILLDVKADRAAALAQRLGLYKLRAKVAVAPTELAVVVGTGAAPDGAVADPRHPALGWRGYAADPAALLAGLAPLAPADLDALRVELVVPEAGIELQPDNSYILEMGFERLNGVDFRKGCYVGQEVTARMKHKTELRKGLARVRLSGPAPPPPNRDPPRRPPGRHALHHRRRPRPRLPALRPRRRCAHRRRGAGQHRRLILAPGDCFGACRTTRYLSAVPTDLSVDKSVPPAPGAGALPRQPGRRGPIGERQSRRHPSRPPQACSGRRTGRAALQPRLSVRSGLHPRSRARRRKSFTRPV